MDNLQQQRLQRMKGNKARLPFDQKDDQRRNPSAKKLEDVGEDAMVCSSCVGSSVLIDGGLVITLSHLCTRFILA